MSPLDHEFESELRGLDTEAYKAIRIIYKHLILKGKYMNLSRQANSSHQQAMHQK